MYIDQNLRSKLVSKCLILDNIMECVTVEIEIEKLKNAIISCVYRKPGSCIEKFQEIMIDLYEDISSTMVFV